MEEVILPTVGDSFAQEQAKLIIGTLRFLDVVQDMQYPYEVIENEEYRKILRTLGEAPLRSERTNELRSLSDEVKSHLAQETGLKTNGPRSYRSLRQSNIVMKRLLCEILRTVEELPASIDRLVKDFTKQQLRRERAWMKSLGKDPGAPENLGKVLFGDGE
jgi:hypothetical protein